MLREIVRAGIDAAALLVFVAGFLLVLAGAARAGNGAAVEIAIAIETLGIGLLVAVFAAGHRLLRRGRS